MSLREFVADDGERLRFHDTGGSGPPVLLLHGWTSNHANWSPLLAPLAGWRVLRPDARGHGGHRPGVDRQPGVARLARDVVNLLDHLGLDRVVAVGHSMGALTLWQCVRDFGTTRFSHFAFIDQSPRLTTDAEWRGGIYGDFDAARSQRLLDELAGDFAEAVLRLVAFGLNQKARDTYLRNTSGWRAARDAMRGVDPGPAIAIWKTLVAADYRDVLPAIDRPTLLAYGTASNFYTEETAHYVAAHIPHAQLDFYPGADHCPHLAAPERFAEALQILVHRSDGM